MEQQADHDPRDRRSDRGTDWCQLLLHFRKIQAERGHGKDHDQRSKESAF